MTTIKIQKNAPVGEIILNSPETLNLIEEDTFQAINQALTSFENDNEIKVVLLKAICGVSKKTGKKIFSAGVNLNNYEQKFELLEKNPAKFRENLIKNRELPDRIEKFTKPIVIGIDGLLIGGFFELALACDVILASTDAVFSLNEVNLGLIPGYGGIYRLLRLIGKNKAYEIITTGRQILPDEALMLGIVTKILPEEEFLNYCNSLASKPYISLQLVKDTMRRIIEGKDADEIEVRNFMKAAYSEQARQKIMAFIDKT
ncbi:MAG: hypothetical protein A2Y25_01460 [Candidatus Melainabacteria bacterium GWF2_37_15]|nr:MAG: hypothetical protein A2Y25_01460 [Candidatus Melainabacteria bacterium GWF2_37_15]